MMINNALNTRNESLIKHLHNLSSKNSVLVWKEDIDTSRDKWIESLKLLKISDETCKVKLSSDSTEFRSTCVKSFYEESELDEKIESIKDEILRISSREITFEINSEQKNIFEINFESSRFLKVHISIR
jgi:hypothetical protein